VITVLALKRVGPPAPLPAAFGLVSPGNGWRDLFAMVTAGLSGAMAFSLALA
jgi:hypothetical protein